MTDTNLQDLHPYLQPIAQKCLDIYEIKYPNRHPAKIIQTWRSAADQQQAYDDGLSNAKPGESKHEFMINGKPASRAFDFAVFNDDGSYISDGTDEWYEDFADIGKSLGLCWGGDWTGGFKDYDHLELPD